MKLSCLPYTIFLKHEFRISHSARNSTPAVLIKIEDGDCIGYGESSLPPYLPETTESVFEYLRGIRLPDLADYQDLTDFIEWSDRKFPFNRAAKAAVDIALHDLLGKRIGKKCSEFFGTMNSELPFTSFTIGISDSDLLGKKIAEADRYKILKIKLGTDRDKEIISTVRSITDKPIYVDANQAWKDKEDALKMIEWLADKNILLVEQPMDKNNYNDSAWLQKRSPLPVIADEAFQDFNDLEQIGESYSGINIKLMKCGGLHEAFRIIRKGKDLGLKIMLGCMTETSCAVSAAIHLSALADYADLDGNLLIKNDPFINRTTSCGRLILPSEPGIGVSPARSMQFLEL
jgi:L-Ala-D/L-Glu epimerase